MFQAYVSWCSNPSIKRMHKMRYYCHLSLVPMSIVLLLATSIVLAYSIKMYYGGFLNSIPELLTASSASLILLGLAWLPSDQYPGAYGLDCMRYVWQELVWSGGLSLGLFGGLMSLHRATPGLMSSCGRYFICRGYIFIFVAAWFSWLLIGIPTGLLLCSAIYQALYRRCDQSSVWKCDIARFEYFWPGQANLKARRSIHPDSLPRVQPDTEDIKSPDLGFPLENEKSKAHHSTLQSY